MILIKILILALAIPIGFLIASWTKDEAKVGKKYFRDLIIISIMGLIGFGFMD